MGHENFKDKYLGEHRKFFGKIDPTSITAIKKGQVVKFLYDGEERTVFVVTRNWKGKLHGMDLAGVPRKLFLPIINSYVLQPKVSSEKLYDQHIKKPRILELQAYRTFDRFKISNIKSINYDSTLQPNEKGEGIPDPSDPDQFVVTDQSF